MGSLKRVSVDSLVIGKKYVVEIKGSFWNTNSPLTYIGTPFKNKREHYFSYGTLNDWKNNFGVCACKSNLKVYEKEGF